jgi:two-component system chemotaxis response regulator CheB
VPIAPLVVIGASAGGLDAVGAICASLPEDFPAPVVIVLHLSPDSPGVSGDIVDRAGKLSAANARDGERLRPGHIYVAPPNFHLLVEPGRLRLTKGPKENRFRPAIDPLFRSAAQVYGPRAIGVVLTGNLDDGSAGLWAVKHMGGTTIVQDPRDARYPSMPTHAVEHVGPDYVVPAAEIGPLLDRLVREPSTVTPDLLPLERTNLDTELNIAKERDPVEAGLLDLGSPSLFACPSCHGVLLALREGKRVRYRCHTGHAYSLDALLSEMRDMVEEAQWNALRATQEAVLLLRNAATAAPYRDDEAARVHLVGEADRQQARVDVLRVLLERSHAGPDRPEDVATGDLEARAD